MTDSFESKAVELFSKVVSPTDNEPLNRLSYELNGLAMRVHRELGPGFSEVVYKDAFELELLEAGIEFAREKEHTISYRGIILKHKFFSDFVVADQIIVEIKARRGIVEGIYDQVINYLAVSKCRLALLYNFGAPSLMFKRIVL